MVITRKLLTYIAFLQLKISSYLYHNKKESHMGLPAAFFLPKWVCKEKFANVF